MKLKVPSQFNDRFQFVFEIDDRTSPGTVTGRAQIYEYSVLCATLHLVNHDLTRLEMAERLMTRCLRWAEIRLGKGATRPG